jgi:hypothetical protein
MEFDMPLRLTTQQHTVLERVSNSLSRDVGNRLVWAPAPITHPGTPFTPDTLCRAFVEQFEPLMLDWAASADDTLVRLQKDWIARFGSKQCAMAIVEQPVRRDRLSAIDTAVAHGVAAVYLEHSPAPKDDMIVVVESSVIDHAEYLRPEAGSGQDRPFGVQDGLQHIWRPTLRGVHGPEEMGVVALGLNAAIRRTRDDTPEAAEAAGVLEAVLSQATHVFRHARHVLAPLDAVAGRSLPVVFPWIPIEGSAEGGSRASREKTSLAEDPLWARICRRLLGDDRTVLIELWDPHCPVDGIATLPEWLEMQLPRGRTATARAIEDAVKADNGLALEARWLDPVDPERDNGAIVVAVFPHPVVDTRLDAKGRHHRLYVNLSEQPSFLVMPALTDGSTPADEARVHREVVRAVRAVATPSGLLQTALDDIVAAGRRISMPHQSHRARLTVDGIAQITAAAGARFPDGQAASKLPRRSTR